MYSFTEVGFSLQAIHKFAFPKLGVAVADVMGLIQTFGL